MYDSNSDYGESCYRLLSRNGHFIYLQTKGYLEIDKETNKVHSFVCVNSLLTEEEGRRRVQAMKNNFSNIINTKIQSSSVDVPASENPQLLEKAVMCLIQNLHKTPDEDENEDPASVHSAIASPRSINDTLSVAACSVRSAKTPPLALVPPDPLAVKKAISKSVTIVNITAAKNLRVNQAQSPDIKMKSPEPDKKPTDVKLHQSHQDRPSVLHRSGNGIKCSSRSTSPQSPIIQIAQIKCEDPSRNSVSPKQQRIPTLLKSCSSCLAAVESRGAKCLNCQQQQRSNINHQFQQQPSHQQISVLKRTHIDIGNDESDDLIALAANKRRITQNGLIFK